jgi:hypothetical protein
MRKHLIVSLLGLAFVTPAMVGCDSGKTVSEDKTVHTNPDTGKQSVNEKKVEKTADGGTKTTEEHKTQNTGTANP